MAKKGKKYEIDIFNPKQLEKLEKAFGDIEEMLQSLDLMNFIADKCMKELNSIIDTELRTEGYETEYRANNNYETTKEQIHIFNDSMVDLSELSEETRSYYENGLSLAKIIEFGTGIPRYR